MVLRTTGNTHWFPRSVSRPVCTSSDILIRLAETRKLADADQCMSFSCRHASTGREYGTGFQAGTRTTRSYRRQLTKGFRCGQTRHCDVPELSHLDSKSLRREF